MSARRRRIRSAFAGAVTLGLGLGLGLASPAAQACATCFGKSDAPMAEGMNMGILALLGVVLTVLAGLATFFVHLGRRSARVARASAWPDRTST